MENVVWILVVLFFATTTLMLIAGYVFKIPGLGGQLIGLAGAKVQLAILSILDFLGELLAPVIDAATRAATVTAISYPLSITAFALSRFLARESVRTTLKNLGRRIATSRAVQCFKTALGRGPVKPTSLSERVGFFLSGMKSGGKGVGSYIWNGLKSLPGKIGSKIKSLGTKEFWSKSWKVIKTGWKSGIKIGAATIAGFALDFLVTYGLESLGVPEMINNAVGGGIIDGWSFGHGVVSGIGGMVGSLPLIVALSATGPVGWAILGISFLVGFIIGGIVDIGAVWEGIKGFFGGVAKAAGDFFNAAGKAISDFGKAAGDFFTSVGKALCFWC